MQIKVGNKTIMEITQTDLKCLKNDLLDPEDWFVKALTGKINRCKKRMILEWIPKLRAKGLSIPSTDEELVNLILAQDDYKNRGEKEPEEPV